MRTVSSFLLLVACNGAKPLPVEVPVPEVPATNSLDATVQGVIDPAVDPCTDFYAYACGGWIDQTPLPPDRPIVIRSFTTIEDENEALLRTVIEETAANPGEDPDRQKLAAFWKSCTDEAAIDARGVEPVAAWLTKVEGLADKKSFMALAGELGAAGFPALLNVWVDADQKNPGLAILQLLQGGTGLPDRDYYLAEEQAQIRDQYREHVAKMFVLTGMPEADAAAAAMRVLVFETELAKVQWTPEQMRDSNATYNKLDRKGLEAITKGLDWGAYLTAQGYPALTQINVMSPSYFEGAAKAVSAADLPTLKAYLKWQVVSGSASELAKPLSDESFRFFGQVLFGQQEQRPRWKRCIEMADAALGDLLGKVYVEKAFPGDSKPVASDMIVRIEQAFEAGLPGLEWMDDETRARAIEKARAITNKIGYPGTWRTYPFEVRADDFYGNIRRAAENDTTYWMDKAEKPIDPGTWLMTAQAVNAYYYTSQNEIVFPAGILQPPFFSADYPKAMNFGGMGMVMGHEITHGFDDEGRKFDAEGRLTDWWPEAVVQRFEERVACVDTQYDGYEIEPGVHLSGELTLGENIADLGGLRVAYRAYQQWVKENGEEQPVAGLTPNQLFFVAHAQAWCAVAAPEILRVLVSTDPHSPSRFRVNGPVTNLPEFAEAFQCEPGEPMRPVAQCEVW